MDELDVPSGERLHLTSLTGDLKCFLGRLGNFRYSWSRPLPTLLPRVRVQLSPRPRQPMALDDASLPPPPCFSEAELDLPYSFFLILSLLSLNLPLLDVSFTSTPISSVPPAWPTTLCWTFAVTAGGGQRYDFPVPPEREVELLLP